MVKKTEINFESLIKALPESVYWLDKNMFFLGCNNIQAKILGLNNADEIIGKTINDFQPNKYAKILINNNKKVIQLKKTIKFEEVYKLKNGKMQHFSSKKTPLFNKKNEVIGILGISINISKIKNETEINNDLIHKIISHLPGHVYWQNKEGLILGCNENQAKSLGFSNSTEVIGRNAYTLIKKIQAKKLKEINDYVMKTKKIRIYEEKITFSSGDLNLLSHKVPLFNHEKKVIGILGISLDISKQKNLERKILEQNEKTELGKLAIIDIVSMISHEIIGKISNIISVLNNIKNNKSFEDIKILNDVLIQSNDSIIAIDYLSKFLYINKYGINIHANECEILNFSKNLISKFYKNKKNIKINFNINENLPSIVKFDSYYVKIILEIILSNSIKYSDKNKNINLDVNFDKDFLSFSIKDNGIGISKNQLNKLLKPIIPETIGVYEKFEYNNPSIKLSYIKKIIDLMGGKLEINSHKNHGTETIIFVPFILKKPKNEKKISLNTELEKKIVLLVEDDPITLRVHKDILNSLGCYVDVAINGEEAINLSSLNKYDIIFMDIRLPDINGIKVMKKISKEVKNKNIFFVAVTSCNSEADHDVFMKENFYSVLPKPVSRKNFESCISTIENLNKKLI